MTFKVIGTPVKRIDSYSKVTGKSIYGSDLKLNDFLHAKVLRSGVPHARIRCLNITKAKELPGVEVLTAADIPGGNAVGIISKNEPVLADKLVRRMGDPLALVAAETEELALQALELIEVEYEELPAIFTIEEALQPAAYPLHEQGNIMTRKIVRKGDIAAGFAKAAAVVENTYVTGWQEHAYLEPEVGVAQWDNQVMTIWSSTQNPHFDQGEVARVLNLPLSRVRVIQAVTGGGFGGKLDISTQCHVALLALKTGRNVKLEYSREESLIYTGKRHPAKIYYKLGAGREGNLLAAQVKIYFDTGAYDSYGSTVVGRAAIHATGPYHVENVEVEAIAVYTNNPICGAMRGFGVPQITFAGESQLDQLAEKLGLSPWEIRLRNAFHNGATTNTGQLLSESVGIRKTLEQARQKMMDLNWSTGGEAGA
jgi:CO/xanthine dehydrogenase Mo-binding subunit